MTTGGGTHFYYVPAQTGALPGTLTKLVIRETARGPPGPKQCIGCGSPPMALLVMRTSPDQTVHSPCTCVSIGSRSADLGGSRKHSNEQGQLTTCTCESIKSKSCAALSGSSKPEAPSSFSARLEESGGHAPRHLRWSAELGEDPVCGRLTVTGWVAFDAIVVTFPPLGEGTSCL